MFTPAELAECAEREVKQRVRVYGRLVMDGRMKREKAEKETEMMREIAKHFRSLPGGSGDLFT